MVIWILGKSGVGKTFYAKKVFNHFNKKNKKIFFIDGDEFRKYISNDLGYSKKDRKLNGLRVRNFCNYLTKNNYIALVAMQSVFPSMQKGNKKIFKKYVQINIRPMNEETAYRKSNIFKKRKKKYIVGKDLKFNPIKGDLNIINDHKNYKMNLKLILDVIRKKSIK